MIEVNNLTAEKINKKLLIKVAEKVFKGENKGQGDLSVVLVRSDQIRELNKKHRKKDETTDVLSFNLEDDVLLKGEIGEVVICPEAVKENAAEYGIKYEEELMRVLIHGILHILGYNHKKTGDKADDMTKKQEYYLKSKI